MNKLFHVKEKNRGTKRIFLDVLMGHHSSVATCEFCGITYFEDNEREWDWEKGQLEELRERSKTNPSTCVSVDYVGWGYIDDKQFVADCPCNAASKYENFIWNHRDLIRDYLTARAQKQLIEAQDDSKLTKQVSEAVDIITQ